MNYTEVHTFIDKVKKQNLPLNCIIAGIYEYGTTEEFDTLAHLIQKGVNYYAKKQDNDEAIFQSVMAGNF